MILLLGALGLLGVLGAKKAQITMSNEEKQSPKKDFIQTIIDDANTPPWKKRLLEAKSFGMADEGALEYAGLTEDELLDKMIEDPQLESLMLSARSCAILRHYKAISEAAQWQAHQYLLDKLWPEEFARTEPRPESPRVRAVRVEVNRMTPRQLKNPARLLQLGLERDAENEANNEKTDN